MINHVESVFHVILFFFSFYLNARKISLIWSLKMVAKGIIIIPRGFSAYTPAINCVIASTVIRSLAFKRVLHLRRTNKAVRLIDALRAPAFFTSMLDETSRIWQRDVTLAGQFLSVTPSFTHKRC